MEILYRNRKYIVYDGDGHVIIICSDKRVCIAYANYIQRKKK